MGSRPCHAENRTTEKSFSSCSSEPKLFANALCPFPRSMAHKILSEDRVETNKNFKRERERERGREVEREIWKVEKEEKIERERGGKCINLCTFCHNVLRKWGELRGHKFRYGNSKNSYKNNRIGKRT